MPSALRPCHLFLLVSLWVKLAQAGYQELVNAIIRPPRAQYEVEALGPAEFEFVGKLFKRIDFRLLNDRGHVLECRYICICMQVRELWEDGSSEAGNGAGLLAPKGWG